MERASGILLPVYSLPSPGGIGTFGRAAHEFVDFLAAAGQRYWQLLPLGPTSYGDSPYQSFSAYAGNPYFIGLDRLLRDGLITEGELEAFTPKGAPDRIDYGAIYETRYKLLHCAYDRFKGRDTAELERFESENEAWLPDYALFMAIKKRFNMRSWLEWDDDVRLRKPEAIRVCRDELSDDIGFYTFMQYLFFSEWRELRDYARSKGVLMMGDMPIYVALDSADVWANPESFQLDENLRPSEVAGVPPDYFSATGQLWGNPLYRWDYMRDTGYRWWKERMRGASRLYDTIRIDHFRGFESYWSVPSYETTAVNGKWIKGPGIDFVRALSEAVPGVDIIAEDLGYLDDSVKKLLADSGFPGMKVLEFAFDSREPSNYLPHTYPRNCVCYVGTHDNTPVMAWRHEAAGDDVNMAREYLGLNESEGFNFGMIRGGMSSVADLFVTQMQDYLGLGAESRMNTPSTLGGNWQWRLAGGQCSEALAKKIRHMCFIYGRASKE